MLSWTTIELSTGEKFKVEAIGAPVASSGELVFTTAMVGYTETLTDPSYFGQVLVFAYPLIGNYGIPSKSTKCIHGLPPQFESSQSFVSAVIVADATKSTHHWTSCTNLDKWLKMLNVPGIVGIDTRFLVNHIRENKQVFARIIPEHAKDNIKLGNLDFDHRKNFFNPNNYNLTRQVSHSSRYTIGKGKTRIGVYDFGIKWNILRQLIELNCEVEIIPWNTPPIEVDCSGWLLSNGPGNPNHATDSVVLIKELLCQDRPILGICLGHQLLGLACGAKITFMDYGHRSHNQPVKNIDSGKAFITSQNHSYVINKSTLPREWAVWFENINDGSIEGIKHTVQPFKSVQFHPEAAGGPRDTNWILSSFVDEVKKHDKIKYH